MKDQVVNHGYLESRLAGEKLVKHGLTNYTLEPEQILFRIPSVTMVRGMFFVRIKVVPRVLSSLGMERTFYFS